MRRTASLHGRWPALFGVVMLLAVPAMAAPSSAGQTVIIVEPGQTLWSLARQYGVSVDDIVQANSLASRHQIVAGQRLVIPAPSAEPSDPRPSAARSVAPARSEVIVTIRPGQTIWSLARAYGVSVDAIVRANGLSSPSRIRAGQRLVIPSGSRPAPPRPPARAPKTAAQSKPSGTQAKVPLVITVRRGETLFGIARAYDVTVAAIVKANGVANPNRLSIGQRLRIPGRFMTPRPAPAPVPIPGAVKFGPKLAWPVSGGITSRFGWRGRRHHDGIDIGVPRGTAIVAALDGEVIFSGWYYGYGRAVILDHGDGMTTLYGHASKLLVQRGQAVRRGQTVAQVGCTGRCTGSHLHFEIRIHGRAVNPITVFDVQRDAETQRTSAPDQIVASPAATDEAGLDEATGESQAEAVVRPVVRESVVNEGSTLTTVKEYVRGETVIRREEDAVTTSGCVVTRIWRRYELVDGTLTKVSEQQSVTRCIRER